MTVTPVYLADNNSELWLQVPGFDDLLLTDVNVEADTGATYAFDAKASSAVAGESLSWGAAEPIDVAVARWRIDGAVAQTEGSDNRTITFAIRVSADDSSWLGAGEEALQLRAEQPGLLKWVGPEGSPYAPPSVFELWTWHLAPVFDLDGEMRLSRVYVFTATAKPWVRAADLTTVPAVASSLTPVTHVFDAGNSTANWTGSSTVAGSGGAVKVTAARPVIGHGVFGSMVNMWLQRSGALDFTGYPYLRLDESVAGGIVQSLTVSVDGVALSKAGQVGSVSWWVMPTDPTFSTLTVAALVQITGVSATLSVSEVWGSNTLGAVGSGKQTVRHLDVGGSVTTDGSIQIAAADGVTALGWVLAATWPDNLSGYNPCLRQYRISGTTGATADTSCVSGYRDTLISAGSSTGSIGYSLAPQNLPEASYVIVARLRSSVANNDVTISMLAGVPGGFGLLPLPQAEVTLTGANTWQMCILGETTLPAFQLPAESTLPVYFFISGFSGAGNVQLDELYLLDVTHGDYSLFDVISLPRTWLDAPDVDPARNRKAIYIGSAADRSDAGSVPMTQILNPGDHRLHPLGSNLLVVTDGVSLPTVTASFYRRGNTHLRA